MAYLGSLLQDPSQAAANMSARALVKSRLGREGGLHPQTHSCGYLKDEVP